MKIYKPTIKKIENVLTHIYDYGLGHATKMNLGRREHEIKKAKQYLIDLFTKKGR